MNSCQQTIKPSITLTSGAPPTFRKASLIKKMNFLETLVDTAMFPGTESSYDVSTFEELILLPFSPSSSNLRIPCLLLPFRRGSPYLIVYAHGNGTDLGDIITRLELLCNSVEAHILAFDYPGYGCFAGKANVSNVDQCLQRVMEYVLYELKWPLGNVILYGCSIGTGPCTRYAYNISLRTTASKCNESGILGGLILQCPYRSIRHAAERFIGTFMSRILVDFRWNIEQEIQEVTCPILWIHGKKDDLFDYRWSAKMFQNHTQSHKMIHLPENATHLSFDFLADVIRPIRNFLVSMVDKPCHISPPHFSTALRLPSSRLPSPLHPCSIPLVVRPSTSVVVLTVADIINTWEHQSVNTFRCGIRRTQPNRCEVCQRHTPLSADNGSSTSSNDDQSENGEEMCPLPKSPLYINRSIQPRKPFTSPWIITGSATPSNTFSTFFSKTQNSNLETLPRSSPSMNSLHLSCRLPSVLTTRTSPLKKPMVKRIQACWKKVHQIRRKRSSLTSLNSSEASASLFTNNVGFPIDPHLPLLSHIDCFSHLSSSSSLENYLQRTIETFAGAMKDEASANGLQYFVGDHFVDAIQWVRRFYSVRFRHCFGADLIYKRTTPYIEQSSIKKDAALTHPSQSSTWELFGFCVGGILLRLTGQPVRGRLYADRVHWVFEASSSSSTTDVASTTTEAFRFNSIRNQSTSDPNHGQTQGPYDFPPPMSQDEFKQIYNSLDYLIVPIYAPSKDFLFGLARWLILSLGSKSVSHEVPPSSWLLKRKTKTRINCLLSGENLMSFEKSYSNVDSRYGDEEPPMPLVSEFDTSSDCLDELKKFAQNYARDFCAQFRRPYGERLDSESYFCFGWDHLLHRLFDDWAWIEPRITLTQSDYLLHSSDKYTSSFSLHHENVVTQKPSTVRTYGWKTHRYWNYNDTIQESDLTKKHALSQLRMTKNGWATTSRSRGFSDTDINPPLETALGHHETSHHSEASRDIHNRVIKPFDDLPHHLKKSSFVDSAPALLSMFEKAGGLSVTVSQIKASLKTSPARCLNDATGEMIQIKNDFHLAEELRNIWDLNTRLKFLEQCACDSTESVFQFNSSKMVLLLSHPAVYSSPGIELFDDDTMMSVASQWMKRLGVATKCTSPLIREIPDRSSNFTKCFIRKKKLISRSTSNERISQSKIQRHLQQDRRHYIATCKKIDQASSPHRRASICFHHVFHHVLLKPGIINSEMFMILDSLWRLVELLTGIECGPLLKGSEEKSPSNKDARSAAPSSSQAAFMVNLTYSILFTRRMLNIINYSLIPKISPRQSLLTRIIPEMSPSIVREFPGVSDPCIRLFDEIRFKLIQKTENPALHKTSNLGYSQFVRGWNTGCDRHSRHCRLAVELQDLLSTLLEALEAIDINTVSAEKISCRNFFQSSKEPHPLRSNTESSISFPTLQSESLFSFDDIQHHKCLPIVQSLAAAHFLRSSNTTSPSSPFPDIFYPESNFPLSVIYQSIPPCQHPLIRHIYSRGAWWKDDFFWLNQRPYCKKFPFEMPIHKSAELSSPKLPALDSVTSPSSQNPSEQVPNRAPNRHITGTSSSHLLCQTSGSSEKASCNEFNKTIFGLPSDILHVDTPLTSNDPARSATSPGDLPSLSKTIVQRNQPSSMSTSTTGTSHRSSKDQS